MMLCNISERHDSPFRHCLVPVQYCRDKYAEHHFHATASTAFHSVWSMLALVMWQLIY